MSGHKVYGAIVSAVKSGKLEEPFSNQDFRKACPGLGAGTYKAFLYKHKLGNGKTTELFEQVGENQFEMIKPYKYGL